MKDQYGLQSNIPYEERELIQRAIRQAKPFAGSAPRWVMVKRVFGTGKTVSELICTRYGFDPDEEILPFIDQETTTFARNK